MFKWLGIIFGTMGAAIRCWHDLATENLALRQQLAVMKYQRPRPKLTDADRFFWVVLSRIWSDWQACLHIVQQGQSRLNTTQNSRSESVKCGRGRRYFSDANCCRNARFSSASSRRLRTLHLSVPTITWSHFNMVSRYRESLKKINKIKHDEYSGGTADIWRGYEIGLFLCRK